MDHTLTDDALGAGRAIAGGSITARALTISYLEATEAREADVQAWKHLDRDQALAEAERRDGEPARSPLHGVPVGVKDVIDTHDMPTGYGSPIHEGSRPAADAACVALLRRAGMIVMGKTITTEFAMRHPGSTRNPHDPGRTPGGSSSGSAAAVAAGMVPLAIGTQTSGSVIRPAAYCGVVGYKPSYGTIPRAGLKMLAESLDTIGVLARRVPDARAFVRAMNGMEIDAPPVLVEMPRLGFCRTASWPEVEPASEQAMGAVSRAASGAGADVEEVELPSPFGEALEAHDIVMSYEAARMLAFEHEVHRNQMSEAIRGVIANGWHATPDQYRQALDVQQACRHTADQIFQRVDAIMTPAAPGEAPEGLGWTGNPAFNRIWTLAGLPCVTVPGLTGPNGMPVGIQLVGAFGRDDDLLAIADWLHGVLATG